MVLNAEASLGLIIPYLCSASTSVLSGSRNHISLAPIFPLHHLLLKRVRNYAQSHSWISGFLFSSVDLGGLKSPCPILNAYRGYQHCLLKCWWEEVGNEMFKYPPKGNFEYPFFLEFLLFKTTVTFSISIA